MMRKLLSVLACIGVMLMSQNAYAAMSYDQALQYQSMHSEEVKAFTNKVKDIYGEKNKCRYFGMMNGKRGHFNSGGGLGQRTLLNFLVDYGFENIQSEPYAYIRWIADLAGRPDKGYEPKYLNLVFADNYVKRFPLQGWEYHFITGPWFTSAHQYDGRIKLTDVDLYEMSKHGNVLAISIDAGDGSIVNFFYSGDKNKTEKQWFNNGVKHALKILEINDETMEAKLAETQKLAEQERVAKLRAEVEAEIKADAEKEAMRKQILAEMEAKKH